MKRRFPSLGLTLIELLVVVAVLAILAVVVYSMIDPAKQKARVNYAHAKKGVAEIGRAVQIYEANNGGYPADVPRNVMPTGLAPLIRGEVWPSGPFEGSVYDYDNWKDEECWDGSTGNVQITLRQIPGFNPDGTDNWAIYYVLEGTGIPHCREPLFKGECVNCSSYTVYPN
ncbi:MAG TPA: prepilin-type N-terminal cleavage/methylation domain-containing protein [Patescibacteria group bacterium]|nr:prepilin-type N-terminal cleavage/methylation domain-containing protein [Patescibacteria group bacterium]